MTSVWAKMTMSEWLFCVFSRHALQCEAVIHSETIGDINNVSYMSLPAFDLLSWIIFEFESTVCVKYWDTLFSVVILLPCERIGVNFYKAARLEPPTFQTPRLSGFWAPPNFLSHATPIMKLSSVVYRTIKWLQMIFMPIRPAVRFESNNGSCKL